MRELLDEKKLAAFGVSSRADLTIFQLAILYRRSLLAERRRSCRPDAARRSATGTADGREARPLMRVEGARVNRISAEGALGDGPEPGELATSDRQ